MASSKKREKQAVDEEQAEVPNAQLMSQFADIITESLLERDLNDLESFELYAHHLRTHLHTKADIFKNRFSDGYRALIEELEKEPII
jgi:hypothetical protein